MTIDTLVTELGFEVNDQNLKKYENAIKDLLRRVQNISDQNIDIDTSASQRSIRTLMDRLNTLSNASIKTAKTLGNIGNSATKGIQTAIRSASNLASTLSKVALVGVTGTGINAGEIAGKATEAESFGSDFGTVSAITKGLKNIDLDDAIDIFEEMKTKVGLSISSLKRDLKSGEASIKEFNLAGYSDDKGKHQDVKDIEEGTLSDLFKTTLGNGDLARVNAQFKGVQNIAIALQKFNKLTANEQFTAMAKLVDINEEYTSSMDDWLGGTAQRLFSQLSAKSKKLGLTIEELIQKNKNASFIDADDIENIKKYDSAIKDTFGALKSVFDKATAGVGDVLAPYIQQFAGFISSHKIEIVTFIDEITSKIKVKIESFKTYLKGEKFFNQDTGEFVGYTQAILQMFKDLKNRIKEQMPQIKETITNGILLIVEDLATSELFTDFVANAITTLQDFAVKVGIALAVVGALFLSGGALYVAVGLGFSALIGLIISFAPQINEAMSGAWSGIKNIVKNTLDSVTSFVSGWVNTIVGKISSIGNSIKNALGFGKQAAGIGLDNQSTNPTQANLSQLETIKHLSSYPLNPHTMGFQATL